MKDILPFILFSSLLTAAYSAIYFERQSAIPEGHENVCYDKEDNVFYKKGEEMKWRTTVCGRKICTGGNGKGLVYAEIQTCGKVKAHPECQIEVNLNLPYPKCCEMIVCPKTAGMETNVFIDQYIKY